MVRALGLFPGGLIRQGTWDRIMLEWVGLPVCFMGLCGPNSSRWVSWLLTGTEVHG